MQHQKYVQMPGGWQSRAPALFFPFLYSALVKRNVTGTERSVGLIDQFHDDLCREDIVTVPTQVYEYTPTHPVLKQRGVDS